MVKEVKKRNWTGVFYPESAPKNWPEVIDGWHLPVLVSPLHNLDVKNEDGELKKEHYHLIASFDGPTPFGVVVGLFGQLGCSMAEPVNSVKAMERYMCHLDCKDKVHYDVAELKCFGGYEVKYLGDEYDADGIQAIISIVEELGIVIFADLVTEIAKRHKEYMPTLTRYHSFFNNYCYSRERMAKNCDNGSYVKYVKTRREGMGL